jgi:ATP-dependent protease HslVU (ClpYQ) peptidase subunit
MTTIVAVKKDGFVAIAADTLTTFGNTKESAIYVVNHEKIFKYRENYLAMTGWGSSQQALEDYLSKTKKKISFDNVADIFRAGLLIHKALKDNYFLRPDDNDSDSFETSRADILIANAYGIFSLTEYRYVQEFSRFYAYGSGDEYAIGAMFAVYEDESKTAEDIARIGINAGAEFDDGTSLPMNCYTVKLK